MVRGAGRRPRSGRPCVPAAAGEVRGFTLPEVLAALLVLDVGLLSVAGLAVTTGRTLAEAVRRERAVAAVSSVADSLAVARRVTPGEAPVSGAGKVVWTAAGRPADGLVQVRIEARSPDGRSLLAVDAVVESGTRRDLTPRAGSGTARGDG